MRPAGKKFHHDIKRKVGGIVLNHHRFRRRPPESRFKHLLVKVTNNATTGIGYDCDLRWSYGLLRHIERVVRDSRAQKWMRQDVGTLGCYRSHRVMRYLQGHFTQMVLVVFMQKELWISKNILPAHDMLALCRVR